MTAFDIQCHTAILSTNLPQPAVKYNTFTICHSFLGVLANLREVTFSLAVCLSMSVRPSVHMEQHGS